MVHIIISSVMALLFVGQAITGTRMLLGVPLSWQEPYIQQLYEQQLPTLLERCLIALSQQTLQDQVKVLVGRDWQTYPAGFETLPDRFQTLHWITAPQGATVPKRRSLGIQQSQGEIITLLEDDCIVPSDWCTTLHLDRYFNLIH